MLAMVFGLLSGVTAAQACNCDGMDDEWYCGYECSGPTGAECQDNYYSGFLPTGRMYWGYDCDNGHGNYNESLSEEVVRTLIW